MPKLLYKRKIQSTLKEKFFILGNVHIDYEISNLELKA